MKIKATFDNPLDHKQRITKSIFLPHSAFNLVKELMAKSNEGGLIILPVEIEVEYNDGSTQSTTIFLSTLRGQGNNRINKLVKPVAPENVIIKEGCDNDANESWARRTLARCMRKWRS